MLTQKSLSEMKNTVVENGLFLERRTFGQSKPVSKIVNEKEALIAAKEMKMISKSEIIF
jgi:hypothetical protein